MAKDAQRRQKAQMKKRSKDKQRKAKTKNRAMANIVLSPEYRVRHAREYPIHECWINKSWQKDGLATILLSRKQPDGDIVFGVYLVDIHCLGLKNTFCNANFTTFRYENEVIESYLMRQNIIKCPVALAMDIIYGAIDYAAELGFSPQKDFKLSKHILEDRDSVEITGKVKFGKDGKPFYCAGPDDNVERIMSTLRNNVGEDNFHFIIPVDSWEESDED